MLLSSLLSSSSVVVLINYYLIDHSVGSCVYESVLLGAPEVRRVGGLPRVYGGGGEGLGLGLH